VGDRPLRGFRPISVSVLLGFVAWLLCFQAFLGQASAMVASTEDAQQGAMVRVLHSDSDGILIEVNTPGDFPIHSASFDGHSYEWLSLPGWNLVAEAGRPSLPFISLAFGLPPDAEVRVEVLEDQVQVLDGTYRILPAPLIDYDWDGMDALVGVEQRLPVPTKRYAEDPAVYQADAFYPEQSVQVVDQAFVRHQRLARLVINPFQYNPRSGLVRQHEHLLVHLSFAASPSTQTAQVGRVAEPAAFEHALRSSLVNYQTAQAWRGYRRLGSATAGWIPPQPAYKISVKEPGFYSLSYSYLSQAGLPVDALDPTTLKLFNLGREMAIMVVGEADSSFDAGDSIIFYGQATHSKYTDENIYWLTYGGSLGLRMGVRDGSPGSGPLATSFFRTQVSEENLLYRSQMEGDDNKDRWCWSGVTAPVSGTAEYREYAFEVSFVATEPLSATFKSSLHGGGTFQHHTRLYMNGHLIDDATWAGMGERVVEAAFPQSYLLNGENRIKVELPNDTGQGFDRVYLDWFAIGYHDTFVAEGGKLWFGGEETEAVRYRIEDLLSSGIPEPSWGAG